MCKPHEKRTEVEVNCDSCTLTFTNAVILRNHFKDVHEATIEVLDISEPTVDWEELTNPTLFFTS